MVNRGSPHVQTGHRERRSKDSGWSNKRTASHALRELADPAAALRGEPRAPRIASFQLREAAQRRARRDGALELRVVHERERL